MKNKIAVVTGSRADFGLLQPVIADLMRRSKLKTEVWATGMHLSETFGNTVESIEKLWPVTEKVECLFADDSSQATTKAVGKGLLVWSEVLERNRPDLIVLLGDRFEILAVAQAALFFRIPVAHLCGGDVTEGAFDESIRHSITKMSHLHFVTNKDAFHRVIQLGENPKNIHDFGSPAIDLMKEMKLLEREEIARELKATFSKQNFLITYHPVTLESGDIRESMRAQIRELLEALKTFSKDSSFFFTGANADSAYSEINEEISKFCEAHPNANMYTSLGQLRYWSLMKQVDVVVGNSSSGLYEAPTFKKPTVNIGNRQKGRLQATSVIDCDPTAQGIREAIEKALITDCGSVVNPYGTGGTAKMIGNEIEKIKDFQSLIQKHFFDYEIKESFKE